MSELDDRYELNLAGTWTDITGKVYTRADVEITRGRDDGEAQAGPSKAKLTINNRGGEFSPRNPRSPYFEILGRNTPLRISLPYGSSYLWLPGGTGDYISAPDSAAISITGDIDVRVDASLAWRQAQDLISKYTTTGNQRSWALNIDADGFLQFVWSANGTSTLNAFSTEAVPEPADGRQAVRATLDVNNGAAGNTVTFYVADTITGTWTQLGDPVTQTGTTSIFDSSSTLAVGDIPTSGNDPARGLLHAFEVRSGIAGTVVAGLDFSAGLFGVPYLVGTPVAQASGVSATVSLTVTTPVPAGDTIRLVIGSSGGSTVSSVADSAGNTYSVAASATGGTPRTHLYRATATTALEAGDTIAVTMSTSGNAYNLIAAASSGVLAVDVADDASGTSTTPSVTSPTLAAAYELAVAAISNGNGGGSPSWAAGWTVLATAHDGSTQWTSAAYKTTSATTAVTASATIVSAAWTALVATFTPQATTLGTGPFLDAYGNTWTLNGDTVVDDRDYRFHGEVSSWPPRWDVSDRDVWVEIEASGITQRLGQGASPLRSTMFRAHASPSLTRVKAYWPCEDGPESASIASGLPGGPAMRITGSPDLGSYDEWTASDAMPTLRGASLTGTVPAYTATGEVQVYFFLFIDTAVASETKLFSVLTTGTARNFDIYVLANGNLRVRAQDSDGTAIDDGGGSLDAEIGFGLNSRGFLIIGLQLTQDGSDVDWAVAMQDFAAVDTISGSLETFSASGTITGKTFGRATSVTIGAQGGLDDIKLSHIVVSDDIAVWLTDVADAVRAYAGEDPAARFTRLCEEEGITPVVYSRGTGNDTTLGDQRIKPLLELLQETADADAGLRYEPRETMALGLRTRLSLYNQPARLSLDYAAGHITPPFEPTDDDQLIRNDITVTRDQGSSVRVEQTTGPLSTNQPPDGVGRYDTSVTLSLADDDQLTDQASWRLHLGTVDEARYPTVTIKLHAPAFANNPALAAAVKALDMGDRLTIDNPPDWLPADQISLIVQGYIEVLGPGRRHELTFNCSPESPFRVAVTDAGWKADTDGSETAADFDAGVDTSMSVSVTDGPLWTTDAAEMPINIKVSGVALEVTAISGTSSPQTFTVTQTPTNGITKTVPAGSAVRLAQPSRTSL